MVRPTAVSPLAILVFFCAGACESVLGSVDVASPERGEPTTGQLENEPESAPSAPPEYPPFPEPGPPPFVPSTPPSLPAADAGAAADAGGTAPVAADAGSPVIPVIPVIPPRPVLVEGPVAMLERIGVDGGGPRLGACDPGIVIGVRPTANPSDEVFGQRLTFLEPICGVARADAESSVIAVARDDSLLRWETSGDFEGAPTTEVPDERLIWALQPETFCPESAPALVGLSGEYDPVAPDSSATAAIRSVIIECAPLVVAADGVGVVANAVGHQLISRADSFAASGDAPYRSACEGGTVTAQLQLHAGFWLDGFVLGCAQLRSPRPAGAACSADRECSTLCAPEGVCAP